MHCGRLWDGFEGSVGLEGTLGALRSAGYETPDSPGQHRRVSFARCLQKRLPLDTRPLPLCSHISAYCAASVWDYTIVNSSNFLLGPQNVGNIRTIFRASEGSPQGRSGSATATEDCITREAHNEKAQLETTSLGGVLSRQPKPRRYVVDVLCSVRETD